MLVANVKIDRDVYYKLIEYAFEKCDVVMFVSNKDGFNVEEVDSLDKNMSMIEKRFKNYLIAKVNRNYWIFSEKMNDYRKYTDKEFNSLFRVYFYRFNDELKSYLLSNNNLYNWLNPEYPEDIAFFKNDKCWLSSITHEEICDIYVDSEEEYNYLKSIGIEFLEDNYRKVLKEEIYIEDIL